MQATALLTHLHFDHILGLPFFAPLQDPATRLTIHGPAQAKGTLKDALQCRGAPPVFPILMDECRGELVTIDTRDEDFSIGSAKVMARADPPFGHHPGLPDRGGRPIHRLPPRPPGAARSPHHRRRRPRAVPRRRSPAARRPVHRGRMCDESRLGPFHGGIRRPGGGRVARQAAPADPSRPGARRPRTRPHPVAGPPASRGRGDRGCVLGPGVPVHRPRAGVDDGPRPGPVP